jgi:hypothetical protein
LSLLNATKPLPVRNGISDARRNVSELGVGYSAAGQSNLRGGHGPQV